MAIGYYTIYYYIVIKIEKFKYVQDSLLPMKNARLLPEQIIVPGEFDVHDEAILKIYFRIFERGHGTDMPPLLVAHYTSANMLATPGEFDSSIYMPGADFYEMCNRTLRNAFSSGAEYFLLDGNHKSIAATLANKPIQVLELERGDDYQQLEKMVQTGELFNWDIPGKNLEESMRGLKFALMNDLDRSNPLPLTLKERVDGLVLDGKVPKYMADLYHGKAKK